MIRISITGPESTGKSLLAKGLAKKFGTLYVPEYARQYLQKIGRKYEEEDLVKISQGQIRMQKEIEKQLKKNVVFLDSDLIVMKVWSDFKYGRCHPWIVKQIELNKYDLYLLTYPDLTWKPDQLREHPSTSARMKIFDRYVHELDSRKLPYKIIKGQQNDRINNAMVAILSHCPDLTTP